MPLLDLRDQAVRRSPDDLVRHLEAFELELKFSAGIWFFSPADSRFHGKYKADLDLEQRLDPAWGARRVRNYLATLTMELATLARACGKSDVHHLEREDLVALTVEAAAMAGVPLAGTRWIPGSDG